MPADISSSPLKAINDLYDDDKLDAADLDAMAVRIRAKSEADPTAMLGQTVEELLSTPEVQS